MAGVPTHTTLRDWLGDLVGADAPGRIPLTVAAGGIAIALAVIHALQAKYYFWPSAQLKNVHVNMSAVLVFLVLALRTTAEQSWRRHLLIVLAAIAAVPLIYIYVEHDTIIRDRVLFPDELDQWIAILMLLTVFIAAWLEWGLIIPAMATAGLLYGYFGNWFPDGLLFHSGISVDRLISYTSIPSFSGMLGSLTEESARTIFMFMLFAGVLVATGGTALIMKLSFAAVGHLRAGPAQIAVVSSALFGMISGSTVANVAAQGPYTIPTMRRCGFSREFAAAIEAVSSTGGQITPPVLGLTAFLIVGLTGIPYYDVMIATVFPAAIFYIYMMVSIHIEAIRNGIGAASPADLGEEQRDGRDEHRPGGARACAHHRCHDLSVLAPLLRHATRIGGALHLPSDARRRDHQASDQELAPDRPMRQPKCSASRASPSSPAPAAARRWRSSSPSSTSSSRCS